MTNRSNAIKSLIKRIMHESPHSLDDAETLACDIICDALLMMHEPPEFAQTYLNEMNLPDFAPDDAIDADDFISTEYIEIFMNDANDAFRSSHHDAHIRDTIRDNYPIDSN
jgi:hypothetical protein